MPVLDVHTTILVYGDGEFATNNPQRRYADWTRHFTSISVDNPLVRDYVLMPGEELTVFSGTRPTGIDSTTAFDLVLNPVLPGVYRMFCSGGTLPAFRTDRGLSLSGETITVTVNNNATATFALDALSAATFGATVPGDSLFIPHVSTGDVAGPFNPNNGGFWTVLAKSTRSLTVRRRVGEDFVAAAEVVTLSSNSQVQAFAATGVQIGDSMEISAAFSTITQKVFSVSEVTPSWVEFASVEPLPLESGVRPGAGGITVYTDAKRFVRVETDQDAVLRLNGNTSPSVRLAPRISGDPDGIAYFEVWGPCWQLVAVNRSTTSPMTLNVITVE